MSKLNIEGEGVWIVVREGMTLVSKDNLQEMLNLANNELEKPFGKEVVFARPTNDGGPKESLYIISGERRKI